VDLRNLLADADVFDDSVPALDASSFSCIPAPETSVLFKCRYHGLRYPDSVSSSRAHVIVDVDDREAEGWSCRSVTRVRNVNQAYAAACATFYGTIPQTLDLIAVTGTKGKTTTCHLLAKGLENAGARVGLVSSLALILPSGVRHAHNTTPEPRLLHSFLRRASREGCTHVIIEASSIGIAEERLHRLRFRVLGFTNFGSDHIEFHGGREQYLQQKARLFVDDRFHAASCVAVVNADDPAGDYLAARSRATVVRFGLTRGDFVPTSMSWTLHDSTMRIGSKVVRAPLPGEYNAYNVLAAYALTAATLGHESTSSNIFRGFEPLPGRLQAVPSTLPISVYVDYAHTPESVSAVLRCIKSLHIGKKIVAVLGCSGNSDRRKRPEMLRAARDVADVTIITSDNPGDEDPVAIVRDMLAGVAASASSSGNVFSIIERWAAIRKAIETARPDGVVLLMGKGSENFQLIQGQRVPHSDFAIAKGVIEAIERDLERST
jgi:UDP-N-acetylmuramoyl-L-alanyl-D-glutamate--2,6-diaminopimelate ligase